MYFIQCPPPVVPVPTWHHNGVTTILLTVFPVLYFTSPGLLCNYQSVLLNAFIFPTSFFIFNSHPKICLLGGGRERETSAGCLCTCPEWGPNPPARYVSWPGLNRPPFGVWTTQRSNPLRCLTREGSLATSYAVYQLSVCQSGDSASLWMCLTNQSIVLH